MQVIECTPARLREETKTLPRTIRRLISSGYCWAKFVFTLIRSGTAPLIVVSLLLICAYPIPSLNAPTHSLKMMALLLITSP